MSGETFDWLIYGSGISSLVLAERLADNGRTVALINPGKGWGGVFSGLNINGEIFDVGMTNFEFELFAQTGLADIATYRPDVRNDASRFADLIKKYVLKFVAVHEVPTPRMTTGGVTGPDLVITNQFDILRDLPEALRLKITAELKAIASTAFPLHARNKADSAALFLESSLTEASLANHGQTFHSLIVESTCRKVLGVSPDEIPALFHRSAWAPLFYPQTLLSQFTNHPQRLKPTVFHYPNGEHFGVFTQRLLSKIESMAGVRIYKGSPAVAVEDGGRTLRLREGEVRGRHIVWGADLNSLAKAFGIGTQLSALQKADLELYFVKVRRAGIRDLFSVMLDVDPEAPIYRVTNQSVCSGHAGQEQKIILEANAKSAGSDPIFIKKQLERYGIQETEVTMFEHRPAKGALTIPSANGALEFEQGLSKIRQRLEGVALMGASASYIPPTFNDHVVQALHLAHKLEGISA